MVYGFQEPERKPKKDCRICNPAFSNISNNFSALLIFSEMSESNFNFLLYVQEACPFIYTRCTIIVVRHFLDTTLFFLRQVKSSLPKLCLLIGYLSSHILLLLGSHSGIVISLSLSLYLSIHLFIFLFSPYFSFYLITLSNYLSLLCFSGTI